jgi:hypothetical protein
LHARMSRVLPSALTYAPVRARTSGPPCWHKRTAMPGARRSMSYLPIHHIVNGGKQATRLRDSEVRDHIGSFEDHGGKRL